MCKMQKKTPTVTDIKTKLVKEPKKKNKKTMNHSFQFINADDTILLWIRLFTRFIRAYMDPFSNCFDRDKYFILIGIIRLNFFFLLCLCFTTALAFILRKQNN